MSKIRIIQILVLIIFQFTLSSCSLIFSGLDSAVDSNTTNKVDLSSLEGDHPLMIITLKDKTTFKAFFAEYNIIPKDVYEERYGSFLELNKTNLL